MLTPDQNPTYLIEVVPFGARVARSDGRIDVYTVGYTDEPSLSGVQQALILLAEYPHRVIEAEAPAVVIANPGRSHQ